MDVQAVAVQSHHLIQGESSPEQGLIHGVVIKPLVLWPDDRGHFGEIFRDHEPVAAGFDVRQTSLTMTRPGVIKAFHYHLEQDDIFVPLQGTVRIALVDFRKDSPTCGVANSIFAGEQYPKAVRIPKGVAHGYEVMPGQDLLMVYYTNQHYNPKDEYRQAYDDPAVGFPAWGIEHR